jgi:hypothetical protein
VGLLLLGMVLGQTPIELRYLAFSVPFVGLLLAGALGSLRPRWRMAIGVPLGMVQAVALLGMMTRAETMQPARATAAAAARLVGDGVVLLPRGNDGVGVVGAFVNGRLIRCGSRLLIRATTGRRCGCALAMQSALYWR